MTDERTITATHLRRELGTVLDAVLGGITVHVTRNGRPLTVLVPPARFEKMRDAPYGEEFPKGEKP